MTKKKATVRTLYSNKSSNKKLISAVGPGSGFAFIECYFPRARDVIRISSVYFSLKGFQLGQEFVGPGVTYRILVGRDDSVDVQETILQQITIEMQQPGAILSNIVKDLVDRIENETFYIKSADSISQPFHCKFYICDDKFGWHGSSNYAHNGLKVNAEQVSIFPNKNDLYNFIDWFDKVSFESQDLLQSLLQLLKVWLEMAKPFDVYIKVLQCILGDKGVSDRLYAPVFFQQILIGAAMRQLKHHKGAFIVAATGLGKTIVGSEVALLFSNNKNLKTIILIAPPLVHKKWKTQFVERGINPHIFSITTPFLKPNDRTNSQINFLIDLLDRANENTLIVIDEAHYYRNQQAYEKTRGIKSRVYQLIEPAVQRGARIVLLTATVYGTNIDNLNGLLRLLPKCIINNEIHKINDRWKIKSINEFAVLDIVSVMSISHVLSIARLLGHIEDGQPFIQYPNKKVFLPKQLRLKSIRYELPLLDVVKRAFDEKFFSQRDTFHIPYVDDETGDTKKAPVNFLYKVALNGWLSSPYALVDAIKHNLNTKDLPSNQLKILSDETVEEAEEDEDSNLVTSLGAYNIALEQNQVSRKRSLTPILSSLNTASDDKLEKLINIIEDHHILESGKVLIFIRRHITALYLVSKLTTHFNNLRVGSTIEEAKGKAKLKSRSKRDSVLYQFSPSSFPERQKIDKDFISIDVLICTDADGLGVDLPEADTVVNYDIPEGTDILFQRAGRILRMTEKKNRHVTFYTFVPSLYDTPYSESFCHKSVVGKFNRLIKRHKSASVVMSADVLSEKQEINMLLSDATIDNIEDFMKQADFADDIMSSIKNTKLEHELTLLQNADYCKNLPNFLHSARYHNLNKYFVFLLIYWKGQFLTVLYDAGARQIEYKDELDILNMLVCYPDTEKAFVPVSTVEILCNRALESWCADAPNERVIEDVQKWCAMLLLPEQQNEDEATKNFTVLLRQEEIQKKPKRVQKKKSNTGLWTLFE